MAKKLWAQNLPVTGCSTLVEGCLSVLLYLSGLQNFVSLIAVYIYEANHNFFYRWRTDCRSLLVSNPDRKTKSARVPLTARFRSRFRLETWPIRKRCFRGECWAIRSISISIKWISLLPRLYTAQFGRTSQPCARCWGIWGWTALDTQQHRDKWG